MCDRFRDIPVFHFLPRVNPQPTTFTLYRRRHLFDSCMYFLKFYFFHPFATLSKPQTRIRRKIIRIRRNVVVFRTQLWGGGAVFRRSGASTEGWKYVQHLAVLSRHFRELSTFLLFFPPPRTPPLSLPEFSTQFGNRGGGKIKRPSVAGSPEHRGRRRANPS